MHASVLLFFSLAALILIDIHFDRSCFGVKCKGKGGYIDI